MPETDREKARRARMLEPVGAAVVDDDPLTGEERAALNRLQIEARQAGADDDTIDRIAALERDPGRFRRMLKEAGADADDATPAD